MILNGTGDPVPFVSRNHDLYVNGVPQNNIRTSFHFMWRRFGSENGTNKVDVIGAVGAPDTGTFLLGVSDSSNNHTFVFRQTIEDHYPTVKTNALQATADHELSHHFHTNRCVTGPQGLHDTRDAWCSTTSCTGEPCLNRAADGSNFNDSINKICVEDLILGDPTCTPQSPDNGSIRGDTDPE